MWESNVLRRLIDNGGVSASVGFNLGITYSDTVGLSFVFMVAGFLLVRLKVSMDGLRLDRRQKETFMETGELFLSDAKFVF